MAYSRDFELLWIKADYTHEIQEVGSLDDQKYLAQYVGQIEAELREYARFVRDAFELFSCSYSISPCLRRNFSASTLWHLIAA